MEKIAVIGIGRLGLCLALNLERAGYSVVGVDLNELYVQSINDKRFSSPEPFVNEYLENSKHFMATISVSPIFDDQIDLIFIVAPTPSLPSGEFDHRHIDVICETLSKQGKNKKVKHLVINSTCMPGYCDKLKEKMAQLNYTITYNPEFIAQGSIIQNQQYPDQILIGESDVVAGDLVQQVYTKLSKNSPAFCRMSLISAEITKLATNCFLTTKISFANAIGDIAARVGAEPEKVLQAIGVDSRIGNKYFNYGFGFGGPCFPRDNKAFTAFAKTNHYEMLISKATDDANILHNNFLVEEWLKKYPREECIEFDSITYKKGTDILEESQQLKLAVDLAKSGRSVKIKEQSSVVKQLIDLYGNLFLYQINDK